MDGDDSTFKGSRLASRGPGRPSSGYRRFLGGRRAAPGYKHQSSNAKLFDDASAA